MNAQAGASQSIGTSQTLITGAIAGMGAGAVMAMYAMFASATFLHQGFFTPLYGISSPITGMGAMTTSMQQGFYFSPGVALLGLVVHMMWSAGYGIAFLLIVRAAHLHGAQALIGGLVFGVAVEILMSLLVLPLLGLGGMPSTIGVPSFTIEHLLFGGVLGIWVATRSALR